MTISPTLSVPVCITPQLVPNSGLGPNRLSFLLYTVSYNRYLQRIALKYSEATVALCHMYVYSLCIHYLVRYADQNTIPKPMIVLSKGLQRLRSSELSSLVVNSGQLAPSDTNARKVDLKCK